MKKIGRLLIVFLLVIAISGCGTENAKFDDKVVEDQDVISLLNNHVININTIPKTVDLLNKGDFESSKFTNDDKLYMGLNGAVNAQLATNLNAQQIQALKARNIIATSYIRISDVENTIKNVFGPDNINHIAEVTGCPSFKYVETDKAYYVNENCTNTQNMIVMMVNSITYDTNEYYLNAYLGLVSGGKVYKDFDKKQELKTLSDGETFTIDANNKDYFETYTYVFTKNSDGNYIFKKVLKN